MDLVTLVMPEEEVCWKTNQGQNIKHQFGTWKGSKEINTEINLGDQRKKWFMCFRTSSSMESCKEQWQSRRNHSKPFKISTICYIFTEAATKDTLLGLPCSRLYFQSWALDGAPGDVDLDQVILLVNFWQELHNSMLPERGLRQQPSLHLRLWWDEESIWLSWCNTMTIR